MSSARQEACTRENWSVVQDTAWHSLDGVISRLPRLGSSVRIASPAPVSSSRIKQTKSRGPPRLFRVWQISGGRSDYRGGADILPCQTAAVVRKCRQLIRLGSHAKGTVEPLLPGPRQLYCSVEVLEAIQPGSPAGSVS